MSWATRCPVHNSVANPNCVGLNNMVGGTEPVTTAPMGKQPVLKPRQTKPPGIKNLKPSILPQWLVALQSGGSTQHVFVLQAADEASAKALALRVKRSLKWNGSFIVERLS